MLKISYDYFLKIMPQYLKQNIYNRTNESAQLAFFFSPKNPGSPTVRIHLLESERNIDISMGELYGLYVNKCHCDPNKCAEIFADMVCKSLETAQEISYNSYETEELVM